MPCIILKSKHGARAGSGARTDLAAAEERARHADELALPDGEGVAVLRDRGVEAAAERADLAWAQTFK